MQIPVGSEVVTQSREQRIHCDALWFPLSLHLPAGGLQPSKVDFLKGRLFSEKWGLFQGNIHFKTLKQRKIMWKE